MIITYELDLDNFEAWSGAVDTLNRVREEGLVDQLEAMLEELYPEGMTETELNDLLWFEDEWIYEMLGISEEDEDLDENKKLTETVNADEAQEIANKIIDTHDLRVIDHEMTDDGCSIQVEDRISGLTFWMDFWVNNGDLEADWNQYIFYLNTFDDYVKKLVQENSDFFEDVYSIADEYAFENGLIIWNSDSGTYQIGG